MCWFSARSGSSNCGNTPEHDNEATVDKIINVFTYDKFISILPNRSCSCLWSSTVWTYDENDMFSGLLIGMHA